jgi:hypothetical protein
MTYKFSLLIAALLSFVPPLIFMIVHETTSSGWSDAGYTMVVLDEKADEEAVCANLSKHNVKNYIASSTETAFLNNFDSVLQIPLSKYFNNIETFDPRNDGYVERAFSIFVSDGKRRIFIPNKELYGIESPQKKLQNILGDDVLIDTPVFSQNNTLNIIIFIAASVLLLLIARKISIIQRDKFKFLYAIAFVPQLFMLASYGAAGFAIDASSLALFQVLRHPLLRFLTGVRYERKLHLNFDIASFTYVFKIDKIQSLLKELIPDLNKIIPLVIIFVAVSMIGKISFISAFCFFVFFGLSFCSCALAESLRGKIKEHIPFAFVPLKSYRPVKFPTLPVPFLLAAMAHIVLSSIFSTNSILNTGTVRPVAFKNNNAIVTKEDFENHFRFQQNFSQTSLNLSKRIIKPASDQNYFHYNLGEDGLILSAEPYDDESLSGRIPEFTLAPLAAFLQGSEKVKLTLSQTGNANASFLIVLFLYLPFVLQRHRKKMPFLV